MNCIICDKPISKKARTCGPTCRSKLARSVAKKTSVACNSNMEPEVLQKINEACGEPVTLPDSMLTPDLETCRYCSEPLPTLAKPRRHPGACLNCALKAPSKCSLDALGDTVSGGSERPVEVIA